MTRLNLRAHAPQYRLPDERHHWRDTDPLDVLAEMAWLSRESRAMIDEGVSPGSDRWHAYLARKRALLAHLATR